MSPRKAVLAMAISVLASGLYSQQPRSAMDRINLDRARQMLRDAHDELKKHYYDTKYHGLDLEARYKEYDAEIASATSLAQAYSVIAAFLDGFNDSHTFFRPPQRPLRIDYGFRVQMFGDKALVARVRPGRTRNRNSSPETRCWSGTNSMSSATFSGR